VALSDVTIPSNRHCPLTIKSRRGVIIGMEAALTSRHVMRQK